MSATTAAPTQSQAVSGDVAGVPSPYQVSGSSYLQRAINVTITLGEGQFGQTGKKSATVSNLRCSVNIVKSGAPGFNAAVIRVYGMTQSLMNQLSTLGVPQMMVRFNNYVLVEAGDPVNGMSTVYYGYIQQAWQDFDEAPNTAFMIITHAGVFDALNPVPPISFPGTSDVATIMAGLAARMGRTFENNGVTVKLSNAYFPGTAMEQAQSLARQANIEMHDDGPGGVLSIWPVNSTRGGLIPLISVRTGLIGYPRFTAQGMEFRVLYTPAITLNVGGRIHMDSTTAPSAEQQAQQSVSVIDKTKAAGPNGQWQVNKVIYNLSAQLANGPWEAVVSCSRTAGVAAA